MQVLYVVDDRSNVRRYWTRLKRWAEEVELDRADRLEFTLFHAGRTGTPLWR